MRPPMRRFFHNNHDARARLLRRLDRAAARINPFLIIIAIGLAALDVVFLIGQVDTGNLGVHRGQLSPVTDRAPPSVPY